MTPKRRASLKAIGWSLLALMDNISLLIYLNTLLKYLIHFTAFPAAFYTRMSNSCDPIGTTSLNYQQNNRRGSRDVYHANEMSLDFDIWTAADVVRGLSYSSKRHLYRPGKTDVLSITFHLPDGGQRTNNSIAFQLTFELLSQILSRIFFENV
jgi:hypothetical protein